MKRAQRRRGLGLRYAVMAALAVVLVVSCETSTPGTDGSSHWLTPCASDVDCGGDLSCICGFCTKHCADASECVSLSSWAECVSSGAAACPDAGTFCAATCTTAADCSIIASGLVCVDGHCMHEEQGDSSSHVGDASEDVAAPPAPDASVRAPDA